MSENKSCSLPKVNNKACHNHIRSGKCPGLQEGKCTNEGALKHLENKFYHSYAGCHGGKECIFFSTRGDTEVHIIQFMKWELKRQKSKNNMYS